ncbi:MAG: transcription/translation regulatory transformer protein RfaH [Gammaproteobacteria bacterium]|nr:transcription/translation regulatory transformer protein RfaH [Gammaproteobacteria bacterium]
MSTADECWYLVYSKPRQEETARENLERQGYAVYLPRAAQNRRRAGRRLTVVEPLFPRYLFIRLSMGTDNWAPIRSTIGVSALVRFGAEPARVPDALVALLRSHETGSGIHEWTQKPMRSGQGVRVAEGAFAGYQGIFLARSSRERVVVLLNILGRPVRAQLVADQVDPLD